MISLTGIFVVKLWARRLIREGLDFRIVIRLWQRLLNPLVVCQANFDFDGSTNEIAFRVSIRESKIGYPTRESDRLAAQVTTEMYHSFQTHAKPKLLI